ncbi:MAG: hypothetical protein BLM47_03905 [Candidatus Reconcilbacillus cellulovorans]|uniref:DUF2759 domain-containing protein n=1 Tax=Candidatus Reconcilbacillus cellulovorans TaxID=1906605 RepID=A0A2A6E2W5_9BACL|nr:MAG: hypothetical protein BLM47_03905 [Candidatus Reconcilbacillus cellulovorans]
MLLAQTASQVSRFHTFDIFVVLFTIVILIGVIRQFRAKPKNRLAIVFGLICLAVFLWLDVLMVANWLGTPIRLKG